LFVNLSIKIEAVGIFLDLVFIAKKRVPLQTSQLLKEAFV